VFVGSAVGATGWLLMMTDHQYARMALDWLLAVLNVALTYAFVVRYGLVGAALGTSLARDRGAKRDSGHPVAPLRGAVAVRPHLPPPRWWPAA